MRAFEYRADGLACEEVPLEAIADAVGTPVYVYSAGAIRAACAAFESAFAAHPHTLHYALKANSTLAIVRLLAELGLGMDANSAGEIEVARRAGVPPERIVFTGVGKTRAELASAVRLGLRAINAESGGELDRIADAAEAAGVRVPVALRVNPDIDAGSHPHISTGLGSSKFGVAADEVVPLLRARAGRPGLRIAGLHVHVGSQITSLEPLVRAAALAAALARDLAAAGLPLDHLDLGGGLGISYDGAPVPTPADYAAAVLPALGGLDLPILLEPGRAIVGPAGALVARVVDVKPGPAGRRFVVVDAGMTELLRPALYGAFHRIVPVRARAGAPACCEIVGPLCETSDTLGTDRSLVDPRVDDLIAVLDTGAYGSAMGSTYNRRPQPPEVLVDGGTWRVVRRRQTIDDLLALER
ncbi:MAG TPA: diaminopimelate decarboxylase [Vicinamibacterales bacterium]|nr:diaminopimelate decarboxylase [Vicinamibacterales bacterium]